MSTYFYSFMQTSYFYDTLLFYPHFQEIFVFCVFLFITRLLVTHSQSLMFITRPFQALRWLPSKVRLRQKTILERLVLIYLLPFDRRIENFEHPPF